MKEKNRWDSEGNYHDDDIRLNNYTESADMPILERTDIAQADFNAHVPSDFVERVVQQVQHELSPTIKNSTSVNEIKIQAMHRFMDLIEKQLLTQKEADRCYQRFVQMVHYYYGNY